ncbi:MAG: hypothetical protein AB7F09_07195 [Parvibaculaceae bacterium]
MPERRLEYAREIEAAGLSPPDETTMHHLWQIVDEGVLGATRHVALGNQLLVHLIDSGADGLKRARLAADFIARTRGHDTPVIGNSLALLLAGLDEVDAARQADLLRSRIAAWDVAAAQRKRNLVAAACAHLAGVRGIMAFDYSSTVAAIVVELAKVRPDLRIVVPESRAIAGGARYLEEFLPHGLMVDYIPDAAIEYGLTLSEAVLFGVETLRCDGSFLNTIGSRMIARLAVDMNIAVYGATDLLKLDMRSYRGLRPEPALRSYDAVLKSGLAIAGLERAATRAPELEVIPARLATALLTEHGPVPPAAIWALGRATFTPGDEARA